MKITMRLGRVVSISGGPATREHFSRTIRLDTVSIGNLLNMCLVVENHVYKIIRAGEWKNNKWEG